MSGQRTVSLEELVAEWTQAGLITPQQRESLMSGHRDEEVSGVPAQSRARALAFEGLGYLGGAIIVAASIMLTLQYWDDLGDGTRLTITGSAWAALVIAGAAVRVSSSGGLTSRLRAVFWLAAVPAAASVAFVVGEWGDLHDADLGVLVGCSTAAFAALLWALWGSPAQQGATFVAAAAAAAALIAQQSSSDSLPGLGPWAVGGVWIALAAADRISTPRLGLAAGAATAIFGAMLTAETDAGMALLVATLVIVALAALALSDLVMLAVGSLGIVINVPQAADRWFPGSVAAPVALLVAGTLVIILAVVAARRAHAPRHVTGDQ